MPPKLAQLAIPRLNIRPHHHLLEIGCGNGTAVSAVAERLTTGSILAIDRSGATVTRATRRNAAHIARGVACIMQVDLAELSVPAQQFHTIFALNVNLFQTGAHSTVELVRRALRRRGRLVRRRVRARRAAGQCGEERRHRDAEEAQTAGGGRHIQSLRGG